MGWKLEYNGDWKFYGDEAEFDKWKEQWLLEVPKCKDFVCCHELDVCGIVVACGDCSDYTQMTGHGCDSHCENVGCKDCISQCSCMHWKCIHFWRNLWNAFKLEMINIGIWLLTFAMVIFILWLASMGRIQ